MNVVRPTLGGDGFVGEFSTPEGGGPFPAVLVFCGSGGGTPEAGYASALTDVGSAVLALSYFKAPGLPDELSEIPLEYFDRALAWLRARPEVDDTRVAVMARSRGSEPAQFLALRHPDEVHALVLGAPTYVGVQAYPGDGPAWTSDGEPVAFHQDGWPTGPFPIDAPAAIPIERFPGPVLCVAGDADQIWPSSDFVRVIEARRAAARVPTQVLVYPGALHAVGVMLPTDEDSPTGAARRDAWPRVLAFLADPTRDVAGAHVRAK